MSDGAAKTDPLELITHRRVGVSLRVKLTLWLVAVFLFVQLAFAIMITVFNERAYYAQFDAQLAVRAARTKAAVEQSDPSRWDAALMEQLAQEGERLGFYADVRVSLFDGLGNTLAATPGRVPAAWSALSEAPVEPGGLRMAWSNPSDRAVDEGRYRAAMLPLMRDGERYHIAVESNDRQPRLRMIDLRRVLLVGTALSSVAAIIAGWVLSAAAVAPLRQLQRLARQLRPGSFHFEAGADEGSEVTEYTAVREELQKALTEMETAYRGQERFISNVSHEIKTPISVVLAEAQTLERREDLPREAQDFVHSTAEEMRRLGSVVESFLMLTRVRDGRRELRLKTVRVNDLVLSAMESALVAAEQGAVEFDVDLDESDPVVSGDAYLLATAVDNLVRNGVRFSPAHEALRLKTAVSNGQVLVSVIDRGSSIPDDMVGRVFDRFSNGDLAASRSARGRGLNLEIAQGIAELHHGEITVHSSEEGCRFQIRLPLAGGPPQAADRARSAPVETAPGTTGGEAGDVTIGNTHPGSVNNVADGWPPGGTTAPRSAGGEAQASIGSANN